MAAGTILSVGSINFDRVLYVAAIPSPGETVAATSIETAPGGKSANQAVAVAKLGACVRLVGAVAHDANGAVVVRAIRESGVDVRAVAVLGRAETGQAHVTVDRAGGNTIVVLPGTNDQVSTAGFTPDCLTGTTLLTLCLEVADDVVVDAAQRAGSIGARVVLKLSPFRPVPDRLLHNVDVVVVNRHELALLVARASTSGDACREGPAAVGRPGAGGHPGRRRGGHRRGRR